MAIELRRVDYPEFDIPSVRPVIPAAELEARCDALLAAAGTDWAAVYGDREHFGNLVWLTGYDPRFEEALLLLGPDGKRVLLVGIEGVAYAEVAGLPLDVRLYHPFSILGQPHVDSPPLREILAEIGLTRGAAVGIASWKLADTRDVPDPTVPSFVPAFLPRIIDSVTGGRAIEIAAHLIDAEFGLRNKNSAAQIALYEWGATRASAAVMRAVGGVRPGMTELETAGLFGLQGEPTTMHPIVSASDAALNGLRSATDRVIRRGDAITAGVGLWGGLCCRAGIVDETPDDEYWTTMVTPYFRAIAAWWSTVGIGTTGGELVDAVTTAIGDAPWQPFVNPGHLTSYDEWVVSFSLSGNAVKVTSGMAMQCDIIPTPLPRSRSINCEDSLAIADGALRAKLAADHPDVWSRIEARRAFMRDQLGFPLRPEVLPLSAAPAYLPPCWLKPDHVCVLTKD
jgi:hypothetical protein